MRTKVRKQAKRSASASSATSAPFFTKKGSKKPVAAEQPFFKPSIQPKLAANKKEKANANQAAVRVGPPNGAVSWLWNEPYILNGQYYQYKRYQNVSAKIAKEYNQYNSQNGGLGGAITKKTYDFMQESGNKFVVGHEIKNIPGISNQIRLSQNNGRGVFRQQFFLPRTIKNANIEVSYNHNQMADNTTIRVGGVVGSTGNVNGRGVLRMPNTPISGPLMLTVVPMNPNPRAPAGWNPLTQSVWSLNIKYFDADAPIYSSTTEFASTLPNSLAGEPLGGTKVK